MNRCYACLNLVDVIVDKEHRFCEKCANKKSWNFSSPIKFKTLSLSFLKRILY